MARKKLPHYLIEKNNLVVQVAISVLFAIAFLAVYVPLSDSTTAWFSVEEENQFIYTAFFIILSTIFLVLSRIMMYYMSKRLIRFTYPKFIFWSLGEILLIGLFHITILIRFLLLLHLASLAWLLVVLLLIEITIPYHKRYHPRRD